MIQFRKANPTEMKMSQWANDWVSSTCGKILNPTALEFTDEERARLDSTKFDKRTTGLFWGYYEWKSPEPNGANRLVKVKS